MGAIGELGLSTCCTCPSRFSCILDPATDEHDADMERWILYVVDASKNIYTGLHSSLFKFLDQDKISEDLMMAKYGCISNSSVLTERETHKVGSSFFPSSNIIVSGKMAKSFRLYISKSFMRELSIHARENYPGLRLEIKEPLPEINEADLWAQ